MVALYFGGILMGILMALLLRGTMFRGEAVPFVMELPNYRMPGAKNVGQLLWEKARDFLQRAFTVIFLATIVIWFLQTFGTHLNLVADSKDSILAVISGRIAPVSYTHLLRRRYRIWQRRWRMIRRVPASPSPSTTVRIPFTQKGCSTACRAGASARPSLSWEKIFPAARS